MSDVFVKMSFLETSQSDHRGPNGTRDGIHMSRIQQDDGFRPKQSNTKVELQCWKTAKFEEMEDQSCEETARSTNWTTISIKKVLEHLSGCEGATRTIEINKNSCSCQQQHTTQHTAHLSTLTTLTLTHTHTPCLCFHLFVLFYCFVRFRFTCFLPCWGQWWHVSWCVCGCGGVVRVCRFRCVVLWCMLCLLCCAFVRWKGRGEDAGNCVPESVP